MFVYRKWFLSIPTFLISVRFYLIGFGIDVLLKVWILIYFTLEGNIILLGPYFGALFGPDPFVRTNLILGLVNYC